MHPAATLGEEGGWAAELIPIDSYLALCGFGSRSFRMLLPRCGRPHYVRGVWLVGLKVVTQERWGALLLNPTTEDIDEQVI